MKRSLVVIVATAGGPASGQLAWPVDLPEAGLPAVLRELLATRPEPESRTVSQASSEDWQDVCETLDGDAAAYRRLVDRYQQLIAAYMWRFTRDRREWEELVQDVFVEAYTSLKTYAGNAPLLHWLKRIATRVGYRCWKSKRTRTEYPLPDDADLLAPVDETDSARHAAELVHLLLARLSSRDRLVMTLIHLEQCSVRQAAELTGWSQSMVKVQAHRARRRLAKLCREMGVDYE